MADESKVVPLKTKVSEPKPVSGLPETVVIGPYEYALREMDMVEQLQSGAMGHCDESDLEIAVALTTAPVHQAETVVHELLHALWGAGSLPDEGPVDEELIVTVLAKGILQVVRDNPALIGWVAAAYGLPRS